METLDKTSFFASVIQLVKLIPKGRVSTYGTIAEAVSQKSAARMVGWVLQKCKEDIPAHRVVNNKGFLTGNKHFEVPMQKLLQKEGIAVKQGKIIAFKDVFWNPKTELEIR